MHGEMHLPPSASVVIPSFGRPDQLRACIHALAQGRRLPDQVVIATRHDDYATLAVADAEFPFPIDTVTVSTAGHIPPLFVGTQRASGEIVFVCDDDAEPHDRWIERALDHFSDPTVGAVGGLVLQPGFDEGVEATTIGKITWSGRFDNTHLHHLPANREARDVDVLRGTNMSFRRELIARYPWDMRLNGGAATDYEVALCAWVRRAGYRVVYDPEIIVVHHLAPRPEIGRDVTARTVFHYSHNLVYVSATALPPWQRYIAVASAFLIGNRHSYGLASAVIHGLRGRPPSLRAEILPAFAGKLAGLRSWASWRSCGPIPPSA